MAKYGFSSYRNQMRREMDSADALYVRANQLRRQGLHEQADALEAQAERIDERHTNTTYST